MNKSLMQLAIIGVLTAAFIVFDITDKLIMHNDDDVSAAKTDNKTVITETLTEAPEETTSSEDVQTDASAADETAVPESADESETETSTETELNIFTLTYSGDKEIGKYTPEFKPLTNTQLSQLNKEGIVIVGDSIASGYKVYNRLPANQVMAAGSIGARNIHDFKVPLNGIEYDVNSAIKILQPKYICISMGMNDINIGTMEQYIQNYSSCISEFHEISPKSTIIVMSITPIAVTSKHTTNENLDNYNKALYEMVAARNDVTIYYVNTAQTLKDQYNNLASSYSGGDGLHLSPSAYDTTLTYLLSALSEIDDSYTIEMPETTVTTVPAAPPANNYTQPAAQPPANNYTQPAANNYNQPSN